MIPIFETDEQSTSQVAYGKQGREWWISDCFSTLNNAVNDRCAMLLPKQQKQRWPLASAWELCKEIF